MAWIDDFIEWCRSQRAINLDQAERYESGRQQLFEGDREVSEEAVNRHRRAAADLTTLIARAERELTKDPSLEEAAHEPTKTNA